MFARPGLMTLMAALVLAAPARSQDAGGTPLLADARVKAALKQIKDEQARTLREQIEICEIPAPTGKEAVRGQDFAKRLRAAGLTDVTVDKEGNVIGRRAGAGQGPTLVLSAHLDTVFPEGVDVKVTQKDGRYHGRGLVDDSLGLAAVLSVLRAMQDSGIKTRGDVLFVATVGEEGLGNLRGVKGLFRDRKGIDGFISVDSSTPDGRGRIVQQATGSRRWELTFTATGGHSFFNFGSASAIHAMGRAIAKIAEMRVPADPKTTFTVGVVSGGTSVNAIADKAQMQVDLRSNSPQELAAAEAKMLALVAEAVKDENARWNATDVKVSSELVGDRPAGATIKDSPVVAASLMAAAALGMAQPTLIAASTDANVPLALGIPAATVNGGGRGDKFHSTAEWYEPVDAWLGPQAILLTTLSLVGVDGVSEPTLQRKKR